VSDQLPPEALAADPVGEPERTANASRGLDGPEGKIEDADQQEIPDGSVTHDHSRGEVEPGDRAGAFVEPFDGLDGPEG
jgi:hypothetical protein